MIIKRTNSEESDGGAESKYGTLAQDQSINSYANKSDSDDIASKSIITNENREQILDGIKQYLTSFANKNPDLKENLDQYLASVNNYSNMELEKLILDYAERQKIVKEMELHE